MKRLLSSVVLGVAISTATLVPLSGCQLFSSQTSDDAWLIADGTYATALRTLIDLRVAGVIDDEDYLRIEPLRAEASVALTAWDAAIRSDADEQTQRAAALAAIAAFEGAVEVLTNE